MPTIFSEYYLKKENQWKRNYFDKKYLVPYYQDEQERNRRNQCEK